MILPDGGFISTDEFNKLMEESPIEEVKCPKCMVMTRVEPHPTNGFLFKCLECGIKFMTGNKESWYKETK